MPLLNDTQRPFQQAGSCKSRQADKSRCSTWNSSVQPQAVKVDKHQLSRLLLDTHNRVLNLVFLFRREHSAPAWEGALQTCGAYRMAAILLGTPLFEYWYSAAPMQMPCAMMCSTRSLHGTHARPCRRAHVVHVACHNSTTHFSSINDMRGWMYSGPLKKSTIASEIQCEIPGSSHAMFAIFQNKGDTVHYRS